MDMREMTEEEGVPETLYGIKKQYLTQASGALTLGGLLGFRDEELDAAYAWGCQRITAGDLDQATMILLLLCLLKHDRAKYWRGFGLTLHRRKLWENADNMYSRALKLDPDDVIARTFRAEVLLWMHKPTRARLDAEQAIALGEASGAREHQPYVKRAQAVLATLRENESNGGFVR